jgi:hypothetical protein
MRYRRDYQETHDIDWFFQYQGKVYHAASNGGLLPDLIDSDKNREVQIRLEEIVGSFGCVLADDVVERYGQDADLSSFTDYAKKGFISLDRTELSEEYSNDYIQMRYHIVAYPEESGGFHDEEILRLIPELKVGDVEIQ